MIRYIHGSEDSLDVDVLYAVEQIPSFQDAQQFCADKEENRNIFMVTNGVVSWCYKGTNDELNNGLLATYPLHKQAYPLVITHRVERDLLMKTVRVIRCLLSHCSRTAIRKQVKAALKSASWQLKINTLHTIHLNEIEDFGEKGTKEDVLKVFAFQLGQALALFEGVELFTKAAVANHYPLLHPYLYREKEANLQDLMDFIALFIQKTESFVVEEQDDGCYFKDFDKKINLRTENYV